MDDLENTRKRLIYRSWHRGTREMDIIMGRFAEAHVPGMDADTLAGYEAMLSIPDPDIYDWYIGTAEAPEAVPEGLASLFRRFEFTASSDSK